MEIEHITQFFRSFDRALELEKHPDWMYERGTSLRLLEIDNELEVIRAYEDFIDASEKDSRKVPEAFYSIGFMYLKLGNEAKVMEYWKEGQSAESPSVRLPCFEPVSDDFPPKHMLQMVMAMKNGRGLMDLFRTETLPISGKAAVSCGNCGKSESHMVCSGCKKIRYCGRDCQKEHWKVHKKTCLI